MGYPYNSPTVMTDKIFTDYGGQTGTTTAAQRQAAYFVAEKTACMDMETLLVPTQLSGTYYPNYADSFFLTEYAYATKVHAIRIYDKEDNLIADISGTDQGYYNLRKNDFGHVDIFAPCFYGAPYRFDYDYQAGLPTGISNGADILLALTTYANIVLNELMGYGNEAVGDVGVQDFSNQSYRESRVALLRTSFGTSAKAQFAHKLLTEHRLHRQAGRGL